MTDTNPTKLYFGMRNTRITNYVGSKSHVYTHQPRQSKREICNDIVIGTYNHRWGYNYYYSHVHLNTSTICQYSGTFVQAKILPKCNLCHNKPLTLIHTQCVIYKPANQKIDVFKISVHWNGKRKVFRPMICRYWRKTKKS